MSTLTCPITYATITDPVTCPDGHTYEREALLTWVRLKGVSPLNPAMAVSEEQIVPNFVVRDILKGINAVQDASQEQTEAEHLLPEVVFFHKNDQTYVNISNPRDGRRLPRDIVFVVDKSGSMSTRVSVKRESGETEDNGLSVWDIMSHSVITSLHTLNSKDRASIVTFSNYPTVITGLTPMTRQACQASVMKLISQRPAGGTDLHSGVHKALSILADRGDKTREPTIILFTDGLPNIHPPFGEIVELSRYKDRKEGQIPSIHTFGFGNALDSDMLYQISSLGQGSMCFIPDAAFLGTIFVNAIANILSSHISTSTISTESYLSDLGPHQYGQDRDVLLPGTVTPSLLCSQGCQHKLIEAKNQEIGDESRILEIQSRYVFIQTVRECLSLCPQKRFVDARNALERSISFISDLRPATPYLEGLLADLSGQTSQAITERYFTKWGKHWMRSNLRAHELQICNNFKDPGVQFYGGSLFATIRDTANEVFNTLPPPKPTYKSPKPAPRSLSSYNDQGNPCFDKNCIVLMADNTTTKVQNIKKGDYVWSGQGSAKIRCVIKTHCDDGRAHLVSFQNGLVVTECHPIKEGETWVYPVDLKKARNIECSCLYSFLLEVDHTMVINDTNVICLAHGQKEGVLDHWFYGTNKVVEFLSSCPGWENGLVELRSGCVVKDKNNEFVEMIYNF